MFNANCAHLLSAAGYSIEVFSLLGSSASNGSFSWSNGSAGWPSRSLPASYCCVAVL